MSVDGDAMNDAYEAASEAYWRSDFHLALHGRDEVDAALASFEQSGYVLVKKELLGVTRSLLERIFADHVAVQADMVIQLYGRVKLSESENDLLLEWLEEEKPEGPSIGDTTRCKRCDFVYEGPCRPHEKFGWTVEEIGSHQWDVHRSVKDTADDGTWEHLANTAPRIPTATKTYHSGSYKAGYVAGRILAISLILAIVLIFVFLLFT